MAGLVVGLVAWSSLVVVVVVVVVLLLLFVVVVGRSWQQSALVQYQAYRYW